MTEEEARVAFSMMPREDAAWITFWAVINLEKNMETMRDLFVELGNMVAEAS